MSAAASTSSGSSSASSPIQSLTLSRCADDFHLHLRDGDAMIDALRPMLIPANGVVRGTIMPNLQPPVMNAKLAKEYHARILGALETIRNESPANAKIQFKPLMTLYLTDQTSEADIREAKEGGLVYACKLYPKGATTHSNQGVTSLPPLIPVFRAMAAAGLLLLVHGEVTDAATDVFDREAAFLPSLAKVLEEVPSLKVVLEHITTREGIAFVKHHALTKSHSIRATITAHHLLYNRNSLFTGGMNPTMYCLPILKREEDRLALNDAILSADAHHLFFAGTDSAPHAVEKKAPNMQTLCGCAAGCYTAHATIQLYVEALVSHAEKLKLDASTTKKYIEEFLTVNGATFYGLELNPDCQIEVTRNSDDTANAALVPANLPFGPSRLIPLHAGETLQWSVKMK